MNAEVDPPRFAVITGVVDSFDDRGGCGTIRSDAGYELAFHCTRIADGTRTIPVEARVVATVAPIGPGTWEATDVRTVQPV